jgi:hypothetical protein
MNKPNHACHNCPDPKPNDWLATEEAQARAAI